MKVLQATPKSNKRKITIIIVLAIIAAAVIILIILSPSIALYFTVSGSGLQGGLTSISPDGVPNVIAVACDAVRNTVNVTLQNSGTVDISAGQTTLTITNAQNNISNVVTSSTNAIPTNVITTLNYSIPSGIIKAGATYGLRITLPGDFKTIQDCTAQ